MIINHQIPNKSYFPVALPQTEGYLKRKSEHTVVDEKGKTRVNVQVIDTWTFSPSELSDAFCLLTYQLNGLKLFNALQRRFPDMTKETNINIHLLKKLP